MAGLNIYNLGKQYYIEKQPIWALKDLNISLPDGSFTAVVGKSGSGKTTLLRLLSGMEEKSCGDFEFSGGESSHRQPGKRIGMMFQEPRLMPWLTVKQNIAMGLDRQENARHKGVQVEKCLKLLGLESFKDAYPAQISGGMAQRTALGRTLCFNPDLILMDEPFGALDYFTRKHLQREIMQLFLEERKTIIFVTHDVEEAVFLSQRVLVLDQGRLMAQYEIDLPYPRQVLSAEFLALRERIYQAITGGLRHPNITLAS